MTLHPRLAALMGQTIDCACGKTHQIPVREIFFAEDALEHLPDLVARYAGPQPVTVLADTRTQVVLGDEVLLGLSRAGQEARLIIVPDVNGRSPVCDNHTFDAINARVPQSGLLLAVGAGVINDITKWIAFRRQCPYICLPTAASMNGYTAANVAPAVNGIKTLTRAQAPAAVLTRPSIIQQAPQHLTAAGLGDVVAKTISVADWKLNHQVFGEHYCAFCANIIADIEPLYMNQPEALGRGTHQGVQAVFNALLFTGLAMTLMGTSAPASGGEHLFSHTLDMMSYRDDRPHDLHGRQVGIGTLIAAALYARLQQLDTVTPVPPPQEIDRAFWGPLADAVARQYAIKQAHLHKLRRQIADAQAWRRLVPHICPPSNTLQKIAHCLKTARAAHTLPDIGCSYSRARQALLHAHEIRARITIIDLAWISGILPEAADVILAELAG